MSSSDRLGGLSPGFKIRGMEPQRDIYDFMITIDAEFADALRGLEASEEQVGSAEYIGDALTHDMADVRFVGDSFLLRGITVGFQATGLDLYKEELGRQQYATHNVDSPSEAIQVVAAFSRWEELANTILKDRREDDGLRADGGTIGSHGTRVGHCKQDETDVYVGRGPNGRHMESTPHVNQRGWLGNPYPVENYGREESLARFRESFRHRLSYDPEFRKAVGELAGSVLGCWCQRLEEDGPACHAEIIAEYAERIARDVDTDSERSGGVASDE